MKRALLSVLLLLVAVSPVGATGSAELKAGTFDPPRMAPAFTLSGSNGKPLSLDAHRGRVVLLGFGFTSCPDVCPVTLATLKAATAKLGKQADDVQVIYITVDPKRDDAARMAEYLGFFDPRFLGGTGTAAQLAAVRKEYGVAAEAVAGPGGGYTHSSFVYLIDRQGRLRALMPYGRAAADYVHDVRLLLASP